MLFEVTIDFLFCHFLFQIACHLYQFAPARKPSKWQWIILISIILSILPMMEAFSQKSPTMSPIWKQYHPQPCLRLWRRLVRRRRWLWRWTSRPAPRWTSWLTTVCRRLWRAAGSGSSTQVGDGWSEVTYTRCFQYIQNTLCEISYMLFGGLKIQLHC